MSEREPRISIGDDIDGEGLVTIQHRISKGEVLIRVGENIVAAVDAAEFFIAIENLP